MSVLLLVSLLLPLSAECICQHRCPVTDKNKINVHLIPHSHDDVGWLRTIDQYYQGSGLFYGREDAGVQYILTSTIESLKRNPNRKFSQVETAFLSKWWQEQSEEMRKDVINLVNNGQLEMVSGAWTMNDEATTNYQSIIDQYTLGLRFLNDTFGKCGRPKVAWQIDAYGHSREHASIIKQLGFDALILDRIDFRDKENRKQRSTLQFFWKSSTNLDDSKIFTTVLPDSYNFLPNFCFDVICKERNLVSSKTIKSKRYYFERTLARYAEYYQGRNIIVPMGQDFAYQVAESNYYNIDKLIESFENHPTYNVFYSTPSCYIRAVHDEYTEKKYKFSIKKEDFLPYATNSTTFWSGYFTSRPTLKRWDRVANNILQAVKQLVSFAKVEGKDLEKYIDPLKISVAVLQGHNAITGTSTQPVVNDYIQMVANGIKKAEKAAGEVIGNFTNKFFYSPLITRLGSDFFQKLLKRTFSRVEFKLHTCLLSNISICDTSKWDQFFIVIYNPLSREVSQYVRFPVEHDNIKILGRDGEEVFDVFDSISNFSYVKESIKPSPKECVFLAKNLPPLGIVFYYVEKNFKRNDVVKGRESKGMYFGTIRSGFSIDETSGKLSMVRINGLDLNITQEFFYYTSSTRKSLGGPYVFNPNEQTPHPITNKPIRIKYKKGKLLDEVHQIFDTDEVTQIIRIYKNEEHPYIEFDWLVGNLRLEKGGKEVVSFFSIKNFCNDASFTSDSNGRQYITRQLSNREDYFYIVENAPISSNYYPVSSVIKINDENRRIGVAVITDRAQGGTTNGRKDGSIELMVHRRLVTDDHIGLYETMDEKEYDRGIYVRGQHYLTFGYTDVYLKDSILEVTKDVIQKKKSSPWVLLTEAIDKDLLSLGNVQKWLNYEYRSLKTSLPKNVQILTLEPWKYDTFLLRLEHVFERNENYYLSERVVIDLRTIFTNYNITEIRETTLGANIWLDEYEKEKLLWEEENYSSRKIKNTDSYEVVLNPMEIRTFIVKIIKKKF